MDPNSLDPAILEKLHNSDIAKEIRIFHQEHGRLPSLQEAQKSRAFGDALSTFMMDADKPVNSSGYGYSKYPYSSAAPLPGCRDACEECSEQYRAGILLTMRPYEECLDDNEAQQKVEELREKTEENLSYLRLQLETYGNTIVKRWLKRNVSKRASLLTQAMPELYSHKDSFVQEMLKRTKFLDKDGKLTRKLSLMPYLNIEMLSEDPNNLLALLYYRTHFSPAQWAAFDCHELSYFFSSGMMEASYNPHCITMHGDNYGRLVSWDRDAAHRWDIVGFPRALLTLQAQELLSLQLRAVIDMLINPQSEQAPTGCETFEALATTGFAPPTGAITQDVTLTSPFSAPPCLDMAEIVATFRSRLQACEDELWLLQTDTDYLREHLARIDSSLAQETFSGGSKEELKLQVVMMSMAKVEAWQYLVHEAEQAMSTTSLWSSGVRSGQSPPQEYATALTIFEIALSQQFGEQKRHLGTLITASNDFRRYFTRIDEETGALVIDASLQKTHRHDPIFYNLAELHRHDSRSSFPAALHVRHLDRLLAGRPRSEAGRISRMMYTVISDMAVIDDTLTKLKLHRPRGIRMKSLLQPKNRPMAPPDDSSIMEHMAGLEPTQTIAFSARMTEQGIFGKFYNTSSYDCLHPAFRAFERQPRCTGKYDGRDLDAFDKSQKALYAFWQAIRKWRSDKILNSSIPDRDAEKAMRKVFRSTLNEYKHGLEEERKDMAAAVEAKSSEKVKKANSLPSQERLRPLEEEPVQSVWGSGSMENNAGQQVKEKKKSRPIYSDLQALNIAESPEESSTPPQQTIPVNKTSLGVFNRMYASMLTMKGHIDWDDFVAALIDIGFFVMPNSGSAVTFKENSGKGSIVFHRPHPDSRIDPIMLRSMGKRLRKWFGYDKETFVERGKDKS